MLPILSLHKALEARGHRKIKYFLLLFNITVLTVAILLSDSLSSLAMELKLLKRYLGICSC